MGIDKIREQIAATSDKKILQNEIVEGLTSIYKKHLEMANGFLKSKNYSIAYFEYTLCIKTMAVLFLQKKGVGQLSENEAFDIIAKKGYMSINEEIGKRINDNYYAIMSRKDMTLKDANQIRNIVKQAQKELLL